MYSQILNDDRHHTRVLLTCGHARTSLDSPPDVCLNVIKHSTIAMKKIRFENSIPYSLQLRAIIDLNS